MQYNRPTDHLATPPCTDAVGSVHQDQRHHGHVELWLDRQPVVIQVREQCVVIRVEDCTSRLLQAGKDVTGTSRVLVNNVKICNGVLIGRVGSNARRYIARCTRGWLRPGERTFKHVTVA